MNSLLATPTNVDRPIRPSDYQRLAENELLVTSVFPTIQGEGPYAGHRCVFVRLAGCNFGGKGVTGPGCSWCDTYFAFGAGRPMTFAALYEQIASVAPGGREQKTLVVITGGEPTLQSNLVAFIDRAPKNFMFQVESNGTYFRNFASGVTLVVSPKIPEPSKINRYQELSKPVFDRADVLKFIVSADPESPYHNIPEFAFVFARTKPVYVNPMCVYKKAVPLGGTASIWDPDLVDQQACAANHVYAAHLALKFVFIMGLQMHLYADLP